MKKMGNERKRKEREIRRERMNWERGGSWRDA
jgi:hypothetical protein